jgi:hypothetical protein
MAIDKGEEERQQPEERAPEETRQGEEKRGAQEQFYGPEIVEPGAAASFLNGMGFVLILIGIIAGIVGIVAAVIKFSIMPFLVGTLVLFECLLAAALIFLVYGVAKNIFYMCKCLEFHSRRWRGGFGRD